MEDVYEIKVRQYKNTDKFRPAAINFEKYGFYTSAPPGTTEFKKYWDREIERSTKGFVADDGDSVTGYHYFYLNYCPIMKVVEKEVPDGSGGTRSIPGRERALPDFWDYDKEFFDAVEEAENGGKHMAVLKKRRSGYSYKVASMLNRNFFLIPESRSYAIASEKEFLTKDGVLSKAWDMMAWIDDNTAWTKKRQAVDTNMHKRASFYTVKEGSKIEKGYRSEIVGVTLKNDPNKARGKAAKLIVWEESGKFPDLLQSWQIAQPSVEQDGIAFGTMIAFGCLTAGNKVWNNEGELVNIEDLDVNKGILGYDNSGGVSKENITYWQPPAEKECMRVTTNTGRSIECSIDHPILWGRQNYGSCPRKGKSRPFIKKTKFKRADEISIGDQIATIDEVDIWSDKELWNPYLIGLLIGDGSYGFNKTPVLSSADEDTFQFLSNNFDIVVEKEIATKDGRIYREIRIKNITKDLRELGIYGQTKSNKRLPNSIHNYNKNSVTELLSGLFDADGYYGKKRITLTSSCKELLLEVLLLLQKLGIHSNIIEIDVSNSKNPKDKNNYYRLEIGKKISIDRFYKYITPKIKYKKEALDDLYITYKNKRSEESKSIKGLRFERVVKLENTGIKPVYNLTAGTTNTYIGNGIVTHNTGGTDEADYSSLKELFYKPRAYNILPIRNMWDDGAHDTECGFFVPNYMNMQGFMDDDGNSLINEAVVESNKQRRDVEEHSGDKNSVDRYIAEHPATPQEATLQLTGNIFPKKELQHQKAKIIGDKKLYNYKQVGLLEYDGKGRLRWNQLANVKDVEKFPLDKNDSKEGAIVIWEHPVDDPPYGLYIGGIDPYDHDESSTSSLGSTFIYKRFQSFEQYYDIIVAEYTGRPDTANEYYENVLRLLKYYNARALYENEKKGMFAYFANKGQDYMLANQPDIIHDIVKVSKVQRKKGIHMTKGIKDWAEREIRDWLNEEYSPGHKNLEKIFSIPLLEELISYNEKGNFDRCLVEDTQISTVNGFKNIQDVEVGDEVVTHLGNIKPVELLDSHKPKNDILKFDVVGNYESLVVTDNHPIYTASVDTVKHNTRVKVLDNVRFAEASELNYKYQFVLQPKRKDLPHNGYSDDLMYLLGWYVSDGYVNTKTGKIGVTFQGDQMEMAKKVADILDSNSEGEYREYNNRKYVASKANIYDKGTYIQVNKTSRSLAKFLVDNGGRPNNKRLSEKIYNSSNLLMLVVGYLEGDGHQRKNKTYDGYRREYIEVSGIYEQLLKQIRQILIDNGIWSSIRYIKPRSERHNPQYSLSIARGYINKIAKYSLKFKEVDETNIYSKNYQYETDEGFWTPLRYKGKINYEGFVYNLEVKDDHSYLASNIAVHNCIALMMVMLYKKELHNVHVKDKKRSEKTIDKFFQTKFFTEERKYNFNRLK